MEIEFGLQQKKWKDHVKDNFMVFLSLLIIIVFCLFQCILYVVLWWTKGYANTTERMLNKVFTQS